MTKQFNNIQTIETDDGSTTLYLPWLDETYHSRRGAQAESEHIYIRNGISAISGNSVRILEIGFGTGLNALVTYHHALTSHRHVIYDTWEAYPLPPGVTGQLKFPVLDENEAYATVFNKMHNNLNFSIEGDDFSFEFNLHIERIEDAKLPLSTYDVVYFDVFAPSKQAEIWELPVLEKVFSALKPGGRLVTYCAQGQFKRNLKSVGFVTGHPAGYGKKEMTIAMVPH